jgi:hypothetical protein
MKHLTYTILFLLLLGSCTYPCGKSDGVRINFVSFSEQEINPFTVKKYSKGSNFAILIDSIKIDSSISIYKRRNDTLGLIITTSIAHMLSDFDYKVFIPATNTTFNITDLKEPQETGIKNGQKVYCMNQIVSCKVNGTAVTISYEDLFLKK